MISINLKQFHIFVLPVACNLAGGGVYKMCKDNKCQNCPVGLTNAGTGYPNCVVYDSDNVFYSQGFEGTDGG